MNIPNDVKRHVSRLATAGADERHWYQFAHAQVVAGAVILDVEPKRFADLLALFSPRVSVTRSIRFAARYVRTDLQGCRDCCFPGPLGPCRHDVCNGQVVHSGEYASDVMRSIRASVDHYELTGEIRGPKTRPFARALMGDLDAVVVDTWMAVAYAVDPLKVRSKYVRGPIEQHIASVAKRKGWKPAEAQAAIWAGIVQQHGRNVPQLYIESEVDNVAPF